MFNDKRIALVAGVNSNFSSSLASLRFAVADAEAMADVLQHSCHFVLQVPPLVDTLATTGSLKKAIRELARNRNDDDFLLFYFSGHAHLVRIGNDNYAVYLVTSDFSETDVEKDEDTHISLEWLLNNLERPTQAGKVLIILDCCFSGTIGDAQLQYYYKSAEQQIEASIQHSGKWQGKLRARLTATGPDSITIERAGHGVMTGPLLKVLQGEIDDVLEVTNGGKISLQHIHRFLQRTLPPELPPNLVGNFAGRECILAAYPERAAQLQHRPAHLLGAQFPLSYLPFPRNSFFQQRPGEFEQLEDILFAQKAQQKMQYLAFVGMVGMGGIGKTQLTIELAHRCIDQKRFPAGIFWLSESGTSFADWQQGFAQLASRTEYLPIDDDASHSDNDIRRARHFCRYLAQHSDALLILDNVSDPDLVTSLPSALAGEQVKCTLLYTSRIQRIPMGVTPYIVDRLPPETALRLLLETTRPQLLADILADNLEEEASAAQDLCRYVDYLPLALVHVRGILRQDQHISLARVLEVLQERGTFALDRKRNHATASLFATFQLSWERVQSEMAQRLFKLAVSFKEASTFPLWLLGLASGIGEHNDIFGHLGEAKLALQELSLIEVLTKDLIRVHPLVREFGQHLLAENLEQDKRMLLDAGRRIANAFVDVNELESRARVSSYWECLEQLRTAAEYTRYLDTQSSTQLTHIERWLSRESFLLGSSSWWPMQIPGLFYQQLYREATEEGQSLQGQEPPTQWLRQVGPLDTQTPRLLRSLEGHSWHITSVALSQDSALVATSSLDRTVRIWETKSGKLLDTLDDKRIQQPTHLAFTTQNTFLLVKTSEMVNIQGEFVFLGVTLLWDLKQRVLHGLSGEGGEQLQSAFSAHDSILLGATKNLTFIGKDLQPLTTWENSLWHDLLRNADKLVFSPDRELILICYNNAVHLRETRSSKLIKAWHNKPSNSEYDLFPAHSADGAFSLEGARLLILYNHAITLYEVAGMEELGILQQCNPGNIRSVALSPVGDIFATGSIDGYIQLWRLTDGKKLASWPAHSHAITSVIYSSDGTRLLTGSLDKSIHIWYIDRNDQTEWSMEKEQAVMADAASCVAFSSDATKAVTGIAYTSTHSYSAQIWETKDSRLLRTIVDPPSFGGVGVVCARFSPDGCNIATGSYGGVTRLWNVQTGNLVREWKSIGTFAHPVKSLAFSPQTSEIAVGYQNGFLHTYDIGSGKKRLTARPRKQKLEFPDDHPDNRSVSCIAFSPDGKLFAAGYWDHIVRVWDAKSGKMLQVLRGHTKGLFDIAFSPDGTRLLTGSFDETARLWDVVSGKTLALFKDHSDRVKCVAFSSDSKQVLSCDERGLLFLWHIYGPKFGERSGVYSLSIKAGAVYWQDDLLIVADCGGAGRVPRFFRFKVEGM